LPYYEELRKIPFEHIKKTIETNPDPQTLIEETEKLESAAEYLRDKLLIRLLARLGCRISEALALGVEDINFAQGAVTIEHLKSRIKLACSHCGARLGKSHTFCPNCGIEVEISNSGPKIPEREARVIFQPFFSTKGPEKGTGLGLWISKKFVTAYQGEISVTNQGVCGTSFIIKWPCFVKSAGDVNEGCERIKYDTSYSDRNSA